MQPRGFRHPLFVDEGGGGGGGGRSVVVGDLIFPAAVDFCKAANFFASCWFCKLRFNYLRLRLFIFTNLINNCSD